MARFLLCDYFKKEMFMPAPEEWQITEFLKRASWGHLEDVKEFLDKFPAAIEAKNAYGWTALIAASDCNTPDGLLTLGFLLRKGADANAAAKDGSTALMHAAYEGADEMIRLLLKAGADIDRRNDLGETALTMAAEEEHKSTVLLLEEGLKKLRARELAADIAGFSPALKRRIPAPKPLKIPQP
jgi:ankyrin repeat protein